MERLGIVTAATLYAVVNVKVHTGIRRERAMPEIGEIRQAREIRYKARNLYILCLIPIHTLS